MATKWTKKRIEQFNALINLVDEVSGLNNTTNFVGRVQDCIKQSCSLTKGSDDRREPSFLSFLTEVCSEAKAEEKAD